MKKPTRSEGIELCQILYDKLSPLGYYPALTGGLLYKEGSRKDMDIVIFRNRQQHGTFDMPDIKQPLLEVGVEIASYHGFVSKAIWRGFVVDLINPEDSTSGKYRRNRC